MVINTSDTYDEVSDRGLDHRPVYAKGVSVLLAHSTTSLESHILHCTARTRPTPSVAGVQVLSCASGV